MKVVDLVFDPQRFSCTNTSEVTYKKGQDIYVVEQGEGFYYYVKKGFVKKYIISACGHELSLIIYRPGSLFSLSTLFCPNENCFHYQAFSDTTLLKISHNVFIEKIFNDKDTLKVLCGRYTLGLNRVCQRLMQAYFSPAKNRVVSALCYFIKLFGTKNGNTIIFKLPLTHEDIAGIAGLSRENTTRVLRELKRDNIIELSYRHIIIKKFTEFNNLNCKERHSLNNLSFPN